MYKEGGTVGVRRKGRQRALQILYQMDIAGQSADEAIESFWENRNSRASVRTFAETLVRGAEMHMGEIDRLIAASAENWTLGRMSAVDRNILRFTTFELLHMDDIPPNVSIDEAIEIAKEFSSEESGRFINGILDRIKRMVGSKGNGDGGGGDVGCPG